MRARSIRALVAVPLLSALLLVFVAAPSAAQRGHYNGHCGKLTRQIGRYQDDADRARSRGNEMWLASTVAHIERLRDRRSRLCPEYDQFVERVRTAEFWRDTYALTMAGAKTAMRYFTFGMY